MKITTYQQPSNSLAVQPVNTFIPNKGMATAPQQSLLVPEGHHDRVHAFMDQTNQAVWNVISYPFGAVKSAITSTVTSLWHKVIRKPEQVAQEQQPTTTPKRENPLLENIILPEAHREKAETAQEPSQIQKGKHIYSTEELSSKLDSKWGFKGKVFPNTTTVNPSTIQLGSLPKDFPHNHMMGNTEDGYYIIPYNQTISLRYNFPDTIMKEEIDNGASHCEALNQDEQMLVKETLGMISGRFNLKFKEVDKYADNTVVNIRFHKCNLDILQGGAAYAFLPSDQGSNYNGVVFYTPIWATILAPGGSSGSIENPALKTPFFSMAEHIITHEILHRLGLSHSDESNPFICDRIIGTSRTAELLATNKLSAYAEYLLDDAYGPNPNFTGTPQYSVTQINATYSLVNISKGSCSDISAQDILSMPLSSQLLGGIIVQIAFGVLTGIAATLSNNKEPKPSNPRYDILRIGLGYALPAFMQMFNITSAALNTALQNKKDGMPKAKNALETSKTAVKEYSIYSIFGVLSMGLGRWTRTIPYALYRSVPSFTPDHSNDNKHISVKIFDAGVSHINVVGHVSQRLTKGKDRQNANEPVELEEVVIENNNSTPQIPNTQSFVKRYTFEKGSLRLEDVLQEFFHRNRFGIKKMDEEPIMERFKEKCKDYAYSSQTSLSLLKLPFTKENQKSLIQSLVGYIIKNKYSKEDPKTIKKGVSQDIKKAILNNREIIK